MTGPSGGGARSARRVLPVGARAVLVECTPEEVLSLHAALLEDPLPGQTETVPAARTVLVRFARPEHAQAAVPGLLALEADGPTVRPGPEVVVETVYDGEDLAEVARAQGCSVDAVVEAHTAVRWTSAFLGFAPGFAYLVPDGEWPEVPRRSSPRTAVPAGAVALAGPWSAVYPRRSPGGWQLVGRTDAVLWDLARTSPALLPPGTSVAFRAVRATALAGGTPSGPSAGTADARSGSATTADALGSVDHVASATTAAPLAPVAPGGSATTAGPLGSVAPGGAVASTLLVAESGPLSLVQDLGRPGLSALGVPPSGALDRAAAVEANRLVGNARGAAVVETLGGLVLQARGTAVLAVTGADARLVVTGAAGEREVARRVPFRLRSGEALTVAVPEAGLRCWVGVRGGLQLDPVLGSRSTDVLSGLGPAPLQPGQVLPVGPPPPDAVAVGGPDHAGATSASEILEVVLEPGPRADWLGPGGLQLLLTTGWTASDRSDRVGLRLTGPPLPRAPGELPSEGAVAGAVQVPPSGTPVVLLADHPVTGGYPVVGVVRGADLGRLAQARPGRRVRFRQA